MFEAVGNTERFEELICVGCTAVDTLNETVAEIGESFGPGVFWVVEGAESTVVTGIALVYVGVVSDELDNPAIVRSCLGTTVVTQSV